MSFLYFLKLVGKNLKWLIIIPACLAASIFYFTRHEIKVYSSEAVVYTGIASGYSLSGANKVDFITVNNAFDNLISLINSKETKREVALTLLAEHMSMKKHDITRLSWASYQRVKTIVPDSLKNKLVRSTVEATFEALSDYMHKSDDNLIYKIIYAGGPFYSIGALDNIKAMRVNNSDLIKLSYETADAAICKHTLELMLEVFMRKYRLIKEGQSESVVAYFEKQTRDAYQRLDSAELEFLHFNTSNNIINYYEQTKAVANQKENLYTQNHNMNMDESAASTSLDKVNQTIDGRKYQALYAPQLMEQREELSDLYNQMAVGEAMSRSTGYKQGTDYAMDSLKRAASMIEHNLQISLAKLYEKSNSPNGIPTREMLGQWLQTMLTFEQSKARLAVMDKRKKEFEAEYKKYAPLGAMLKKIERKILVSEKEYLELLHDLSMARLTQQNTELTTKLNVVDAPFLPLAPIPSKRMLMVIVGFVVGFIVVLAVTLARALANKTLQHPQKASRAIGQPLLGIYPLQSESEAFVSKARLRMMQHLLPHIDTAKTPARIGFVSTQQGEGKSTLIDIIEKELVKLNIQVEKQVWDNQQQVEVEPKSGVVLIEFPALEATVLKTGLIPKLDYSILVCRANRIWNKLDKEFLRMFTKTTGNSPAFVLNGVKAAFAEEFIGEVPKKRFFLRSIMKRLAKFEFGNRKTLAK